MAPNAEDCKDMPYVHQCRRILPDENNPAEAWVENESSTSSPEESRRLLSDTSAGKSKLQDGLTLGVATTSRNHRACKQLPKTGKPKVKTKFQKRKDKLIELLRPPYFILTMLVIIVCMHFVGGEAMSTLLKWAPESWRRQPWRLVSYGLIHANNHHLALNALVALVVGWRLELEQGAWHTALVSLAGTLGGALGFGVMQSQKQVVGASAALFALLSAHVPNVCLRFRHIPLWWFRPLSVVVLLTSELAWTLWCLHGNEALEKQLSDSEVAWSAHLLGALVGVPAGFLIFSGENSSKRSIVICRIISGVVLATGAIGALVYYIEFDTQNYR